MNAQMQEVEYIIKYMSEEILKILKIDLLKDSFQVIKADEDELKNDKGFSDRISAWLSNFADNGQVHPEDIARYKEKTDLEYIKNHFLAGNKKLALSYRRMSEGTYKWVSMRMIPAMDYSPENQKIVLFVQDDDSAESLDLLQTAKQQFAVMNSLAGIYVTMHVIDFENDCTYDLSHTNGSSIYFEKQENAIVLMRQIMKMRVSDEHLQDALDFSELTTIQERMRGKKVLSRDFIGKNIGWFRAQFITIRKDKENKPTHVVFTTSSVDEEKKREEKLFQISTELNLATEIQESSIPNIFPAYPNINEIDLYASMTPAKEVGGDFYDFFHVDDDHLGLVIADVSGKGVPAALFMMVSQVLIKNQAQLVKSPAEILANVNKQLCSKNNIEMFVTVWLGILDIHTGTIVAANAGHEFPALKRAGRSFELYKDRHGFVLGGMEGMRYKEYTIQLNKGDTLFVYTDGVAEATNVNNELFGTGRMLAALNTEEDVTSERLLQNVKKGVDDFVQDAPQFDDLTMLALKYLGSEE